MLTYLGRVRKYWLAWLDRQIDDGDYPAAITTAQRLSSRQALEHVANRVRGVEGFGFGGPAKQPPLSFLFFLL